MDAAAGAAKMTAAICFAAAVAALAWIYRRDRAQSAGLYVERGQYVARSMPRKVQP